MRKRSVISLVTAAALTVGAMSVSSFAGSITKDDNKTVSNTIYVASEWSTSAKVKEDVQKLGQGGICNDNVSKYFQPDNFGIKFDGLNGPVTSGGSITFKLSNGKWSKAADKLKIYDDKDLTHAVADFDSGEGTDTLTFVVPNSTAIYPDKKYYLGDSNQGDNKTAADSLNITINKGSQDDTLTVKLLNTSAQELDTASVALWQAKQEWVAEISQEFKGTIDPDEDFKKFIAGSTNVLASQDTDKSILKLKIADDFKGITCGVTLDALGGKIVADSTEPIKEAKFEGVDMETKDNATFTFANNAPATGEYAANFKVIGTDTISPVKFKYEEVQLKFDNLNGVELDNNTLISSVNAGEWKYPGKTAYIPSVFSGGGYSTYINLFSTKLTGNTLDYKVQVLDTNGEWKTLNISKEFKAGDKFMLTGKDIVDEANAEGVSLYNAKGIYQFAAKVIVSSTDVTGYATMIKPTGTLRIPLMNEVEFD